MRSNGSAFDIFDVIDALSPRYPRLYLADLDGLAHNNPQLEYIQELSRDMPLWVDAGPRNADGAIDIIVAGAEKAVLSSAYLEGLRELKRAWRLSTELVFEIETGSGVPAADGERWPGADPISLARAARAVGPAPIVLSPRGVDPDWSLVRSIAGDGPTWVDGSFEVRDASRLAEVGAAGGIFHIDSIFAELDAR